MRTIVIRLRRKLGEDADHPRYIFTEPRVGFWMPKGKGTGWGAARGSLSAEGLELSASRPPRRIGPTKLVQVASMAYRDGLMLSYGCDSLNWPHLRPK